MKRVIFCTRFIAALALLAPVLLRPASRNILAQEQPVQVIEMTAKKYEFTPSPVRVKQGTRVQLKVAATDHDHGIQITPEAENAAPGTPPGLVFPTGQTNWKLKQGETVTIEFVAKSPGTYPFKCSNFCGFGHKHMKGEIVVEP